MILRPLSILVSIAFACVSIAPVQATPHDSTAHSLLWKLTAPNGAESHIFGTMHLRDSTILRQRDTVVALVKKARIFYAELDLDSMMSGIDPRIAMLPPGETIATLYTPEELVIIRKALRAKLGEMASMVEMMRPAVIVAMLMMDMVESTAPYGVDEFLWELAKQGNVPRRGIETPAEQMAILATLPNEVLLDVAQSIDSTDALAGELAVAYANENLPAIVESGKQLNKWPDFARSVNADRNALMIDRLSKELIRGDIFIAVGALHLPGTTGLLRGLETRGFVVTPVLGGMRSSWMPPPAPKPGK